jgi:hypothetical protein
MGPGLRRGGADFGFSAEVSQILQTGFRDVLKPTVDASPDRMAGSAGNSALNGIPEPLAPYVPMSGCYKANQVLGT